MSESDMQAAHTILPLPAKYSRNGATSTGNLMVQGAPEELPTMSHRTPAPNDHAELDLTFELKRLQAEQGWSFDVCLAVRDEYIRFLILTRDFENSYIIPSVMIDKLWHIHLLGTAKYAADCDRLVGRFVHHQPTHGTSPSTPEVQAQRDRAWNETLALYQRFFNQPPHPDIWVERPPCGPPGEMDPP